MNTIEYPSTHTASERVKDIQHVSDHHGPMVSSVPRDNPGVYTRTFNELFKVAKERSAWKIELKGVLPSGSVDVTSVTSDYIPPVSYFPRMVHWHRLDRSSPSPQGMCGDLQRGNQWVLGRGANL